MKPEIITLADLPHILILEISTYLESSDILQLELTNRAVRKVVGTSLEWKKNLKHFFSRC